MKLDLFRIAIFAILLASGVNQAWAEKRVALVIGNSSYEYATPLANPKNDANALAGALRRLKFEVIEGTDLDQSELENTVRSFARAIRGADVSLLFYAGHGLQVGGRNYLAPVDAKLSDEADLDFETLPLTTILKQMERETPTSLIFLDACRDNPLARSLARSMGARSANVGRGLARIDSGVGTLIAFATEPGNVALDGDGNNSPFTQALLKHIETPGLDIAQLMRRVRLDVIKTTAQRQVPWNNSSLTGDFYFAGKATLPAGNSAPQDDKRITELQDDLKKLKQELMNKPVQQQEAKDDQKLSALQKELVELREELAKRPAAKPESRDDGKVTALQNELAKLKQQLEDKERTERVNGPKSHLTNRPADADYSEAGKFKLHGDIDRALQLFESAASKGHEEAMWEIAWTHLTSAKHHNCEIAVQWLEKLVSRGMKRAMYKLGDLYRRGSCVTQDMAKADQLATLAAKQ